MQLTHRTLFRIWFEISSKITRNVSGLQNYKQEVDYNDDALSEVTSTASSDDVNRGWTYEWSLVHSLSPEWELNICDTDIQSRYVCSENLNVMQNVFTHPATATELAAMPQDCLPCSSPNQCDCQEECRSLSTERLDLPQRDVTQLDQSPPRSRENAWMDERRSRSRRASGTSTQCQVCKIWRF